MTGALVAALLVRPVGLAPAFAQDQEPGPAAGQATEEAVGEIGFQVSPRISTASVGETFWLDIVLSTGEQPVDGVQVRVTYDRTRLDASGCRIAAGTTLSLALESGCGTVDDATGVVRFAAGQLQAPFPSGTFTVATVPFTAIAATQADGTPLGFITTGTSEVDTTEATFQGKLLKTETAGGSVIIE